jgi:sulfur carrier protein
MLMLHINGKPLELELSVPATLDHVLQTLEIKPDRVAVEHNGTIVSRSSWPQTTIAPNDRLEIVHFVGGGCQQGKL